MPDPKPPLDDDDDELELEPIDPAILAHQRQRTEAKQEEIVARIDVDELFPEGQYSDLNVDWQGLKQLRFTTRHLLVLTALLAIVLSLYIKIRGCSTVFVVGIVALAAGWIYVSRLERREEAKRQRLREEFLAGGGNASAVAVAEAGGQSADDVPLPRIDLKFAFSMKELFITMTVAAVTLGLIRWIGVDKMAVALGLVALVGLIVQATGFEAPRFVALGWWLLLMMYLVVGLVAAFSPPKQSANRRAEQPLPQMLAEALA